MKKVLITGGAGLLGSELVRSLSARFDVTATFHATPRAAGGSAVQIDLTDINATTGLLRSTKFDAVINAAGAAAVDHCEQEHAFAQAGNITIAKNLIAAIRGRQTWFFQISTDYVFDGSSGPYDENASPNPINFYGSSKWEAERLIGESAIPATIVRVCALYSLDHAVRANLFNSVVNALTHGQSYVAATDLWSNPTNVADVARALGDLLESEATPQVVHLAGCEHLCRYDFARRVAQKSGLNERLVLPTTTQELGLKAKRPLRAGLRSVIAGTILGYELPPLS